MISAKNALVQTLSTEVPAMRVLFTVLLLIGFLEGGQKSKVISDVTPQAKSANDCVKGIRDFNVYVDINSSLADTTSLHTKLELKLRQNGIGISSDASALLTYTCVALDGERRTTIAYTCKLAVLQAVDRVYPTKLRVVAETWTSTPFAATVGVDKFKESMESSLDDLSNEFLNAWYSVNPKE